MCVPRAGGQGFLWGHIYVYVCSSTEVDFGLQTLPEEKYLVYWSPSNPTQIWGSANFLEPSCLQCRKMLLQKIGEIERVQHEGQSLPPRDEGRGSSCPPAPIAGVPVKKAPKMQGSSFIETWVFVYFTRKAVRNFRCWKQANPVDRPVFQGWQNCLSNHVVKILRAYFVFKLSPLNR